MEKTKLLKFHSSLKETIVLRIKKMFAYCLKKNYERKNKRLKLTPVIAVQLLCRSQLSISKIIYIDLN